MAYPAASHQGAMLVSSTRLWCYKESSENTFRTHRVCVCVCATSPAPPSLTPPDWLTAPTGARQGGLLYPITAVLGSASRLATRTLSLGRKEGREGRKDAASAAVVSSISLIIQQNSQTDLFPVRGTVCAGQRFPAHTNTAGPMTAVRRVAELGQNPRRVSYGSGICTPPLEETGGRSESIQETDFSSGNTGRSA